MVPREDFSKSIVRFIINFYLLIIAIALIFVGLNLVNYAKCSSPEVEELDIPIFTNSSRIYTFYLHIHEIPSLTELVFDENYTSAYMRKVLNRPTLTKWEIIRLWFWFKANETIDIWFTSYDPQGNVMENITKILWWRTEIAQAGTYKFEIKKHDNTQGTPVLLHIKIERLVFEKTYFHYGILGIVIAIPCPTLPLVFYMLSKSSATKT